jgi:GR25 family glycosyltransferase involved in LPS biosynthesis
VLLSDLAVYVIHGSRLTERRVRLEVDLQTHGIQPEWVLDPVAAELTWRTRLRYYRPNPWRWRRRVAATFTRKFRALTPREIAVTISHVETLRRVAADRRAWGLIFEDDVLLAPDFREQFNTYFDELPDDADLVYIGSCCGLGIRDVDPDRHFYRKDHPATKCSDSYLVRREAAAAILETIVPFVLEIDWELNYHLKLHDLAVYWLEPPLVVQGSQSGVHVSSLR